MKALFFILLTFFSLNSFAGDKGNVGGDLTSLSDSTLEELIGRAVDIESSFYVILGSKDLVNLEVTGLNILRTEAGEEFTAVLVELAARGESDLVAAFTYENDLFKQAFNTSDLEKTIENSSELSEKEKEILLGSVAMEVDVFWNGVKKALTKKIGEAKAGALLKKLGVN